MRASSLLFTAAVLWTSCAAAQVLSPMEIKDPALRSLQQRHMPELKAIAASIGEHKFPYAFYFSRKLDIEEPEQKQLDQRSIRFEMYENRHALVITGNYYASYSDQLVDADHRLRQTYIYLVLPMLRAVVPGLQNDPAIDAFAFEFSHHVRRKVIGVSGEFPENVVFVIPRELASRVVGAQDLTSQQSLMLDAEVYRSGEPALLWLAGDRPALPEGRREEKPAAMLASVHPAVPVTPALRSLTSSLPALDHASVPPELRAPIPHAPATATLHDSSPEGLKSLQERHQPAIEKLVQEHNADAHFVSYAPPSFITFKQGAYLQLALTSTLDAGLSDSQYKLAALAFDRHVAHLVRPLLAYFKDADPGFDGINFSTTVKIAGDAGNTHTLAVEFILPFAAMNCFQQYDCTGQQLLNSGIILINGERAGLELQAAEAR